MEYEVQSNLLHLLCDYKLGSSTHCMAGETAIKNSIHFSVTAATSWYLVHTRDRGTS